MTEPEIKAPLPARLIGITIERPLEAVYAFAHRPGNFPRWAAGLSASLHREGETWAAETPAGKAIVRFSPPNAYGVLDHWVTLPGKPEIYLPLRVVANGDGTEIVFTLFRQPDMDDAAFADDAEAVARDLATLKSLLERGGDAD